MGERLTRRRLNTSEAAEVLGISVDAVRMRARRDTLESEHDANGRLYVWLDTDEPRSDASALISELRAHNDTLRDQLEAERQAHAEARRLLMAALERIPPQLEAPSEARESPETASEGRPDTEVPPETQEAIGRRWWRRVFGR